MFARSAKSIALSPEVREALGIEAERLSPNELIRALLRAPVDLLFNGGIGTYVKATRRDPRRRGGQGERRGPGRRQRRCAAASSARAGISASPSAGGSSTRAAAAPSTREVGSTRTRSTTSAGVNCSDHEVNIKILLGTSDGERRDHRGAAQLAAGRDDRRRRRQGSLRQLHADAGAEPRAHTGTSRWRGFTGG